MIYLPLDQCEKRKIYTISSRNLTLGVFNGLTGFIGIREKFDSKYLFTEYHYDSQSGTVRPIKEIGLLPDWIELKTSLGSVCGNCQKPVKAIPIGPDPTPVRWEHIPQSYWNDEKDCVESVDFGDCVVRPSSLTNVYLFDYLEKLENEFNA
jgi:hypothetical protein